MKPFKLITIGLWALAIACVAAFVVVKYGMAEPTATATASQPMVRFTIEGADGTAVPAAGASADGSLPVLFPAAEFSLTDHNGQPFSSEQLDGKVWVGFIFLTHCPTGACPVMVGKMADLQEALPDERIHFVSFSIDPERDTPEVLKSYATRIGGAEPSSRWHLLTGDSQDEIRQVAESMKLSFSDDGQHSTWFLLVDQSGNVRGLYGNTDPEAMSKLQRDAQKLLEQRN